MNLCSNVTSPQRFLTVILNLAYYVLEWLGVIELVWIQKSKTFLFLLWQLQQWDSRRNNVKFMNFSGNWIFSSSKYYFIVGCLALVGQHPMKSRSSACQSVHLSLNFFKIGSLIFSDVVHDNSWPWYLVTDEARFLKKNVVAGIWAKGAKIGPKTRFFTIFSSLVH